MAEFGIQATQLSAPEGAGAVPIKPVDTSGTNTPLLNVASSVVDVFAKGLELTRKEDALKRKQNIVQNFVNSEVAINDAVATGQMSPAQAAARSRANFNMYAAGYSEYITDFETAAKALRGFTESGEVQKQLESERDIRNKDIDQARQRGFMFVPGMSSSVEDMQIRAAKAGIMAEQELEAMYKQNAEARAQGNYDAAVAERQAKDTSVRLINTIASENIQAFQGFVGTLGEQVRSGKMAPEMAQTMLMERFSNISGAIQAAARTNPELAGPYRTLFQEMNEVGKKLIDPKQAAEDLDSQLKAIVTRMSLVAMSKPEFAATVVVNKLLPNNPTLALSSSKEAIDAITRLSSNPISSDGYVPPVVGNPEVEPDVLKMLKGALSDLRGGKIKDDPELAKIQASNSVNHLLKQTGDFLDKGATPQKLKGLASFFASPEYADFVKNGKIDAEAAQAAKKTFQLMYEPAVVKGVQQRLDQYLYSSAFNKGDPKVITDVVDIQFTGAGVNFVARPVTGLDPVEQQSQKAAVQELRTAQVALNQLIHIGAHMSGTTDYAKYWEENKHLYMPNTYPEPELLKPGQVINGYKYLGGPANDPRSWQPDQ